MAKARSPEGPQLIRGAIWLLIFFFFFTSASYAKTPVSVIQSTNTSGSALGVQLRRHSNPQVVIDNGLVRVNLSNPGGDVIAIRYNGIDNVLEIINPESNRGYWDLVWNKPGDPINYDKLQATQFRVIMEDENQVEISFSKKWDISLGDSTVPLNVDKRRDHPGIYLYTILEREEGWPDVDMDQIRVVFKLQKEKFNFMAVSDDRQRIMPMPDDRASGQPLAYPEAVLLTRPIDSRLRGEVDDKYQYSCEDKDNKVHGWITDDPPMFTSTHYAGKDMKTAYRDGEPWKKVFGPVYVYLNSVQATEEFRSALWEDAKLQASIEESRWPYDFPQSEDFPSSAQRGTVIGRLAVSDPYINKKLMYASYAYVGLAAPGEVGSWQTEVKGYQFWTQADNRGRFAIKNVRPGNYNLYAWVPGIIGDYKCDANITIQPGSKINLGSLLYEPPRDGPTLWEIGIPDRSAAEFYASATIVVIGFTPKEKGNKTYEATTWKVIFELDNVYQNQIYTLQLALASATLSEVQVRFNNEYDSRPFTTGQIGKDNAIARHGIHGLYWLYTFHVPSYKLLQGKNTMYLTQTNNDGPFFGVLVDNGFVQVNLSKPEGLVTGIKYNGIDNLLETENHEDNRGLEGTNFRIVTNHKNQIELSFTRTWNLDIQGSRVPLNIDRRFIMRRGVTGFYMYTILERLKGWPDADMDEIRFVFKLQNDKFHYMAVSDMIQRIMPTPSDRAAGKKLAYPEAVLLTNPIDHRLKGEVDDKYQYAVENSETKVKGWISENPTTGIWIITPSLEFLAGGPTKRDLTCHMFTGMHYAGRDLNTKYRNGEPWKKVFGPVFVYLNSNARVGDHQALWNDAKRQMSIEERSWPYKFVESPDFPPPNQRGTVLGSLRVRDGNIHVPAQFAYVGLAVPGDVGSWQLDSKGYQFWTRTDAKGNFVIRNVRAGDYNLINMGILRYDPPRNGPTLWEIGIPDRSAAEFFVPDPRPTLVNRLFMESKTERYRQYGLWERYTDLYPKEDLVYNVGTSNYTKDWFFAHLRRDEGNNTYKPTAWQINFELKDVKPTRNHTLQLALASATASNVQVRFNQGNASPPHFVTGTVGKDNAIARHGIHGLYRLYSINVPGNLLVKGRNTIYLAQARAESPFFGVLYDYIRLEGPR
ncbi:hypothetical protein Tsubulata_008025 [Turnera subulata]|uniref:rhamnogalacturonan endolyase n=1 Tax=Turnera subulata TaxID=218843 RepID=A0A9Q0JCC6_9ROSI|nr:hypothetical protein Tsubulata_008025 [Turnera subulata]